MKKFFSFLIILLLTSNIALAQVTRGMAPSWTGGDPGLRTVSAGAVTGGITFKAFYNSLDAQYNTTDAPILYVEYGSTGSLGTATEGRYQSIGNRIEEFTVTGLDNKKLHYYRAVLMYNNKTAYGEVLEYKPGTPVTTEESVTTIDTQNTLTDEDEIVSAPTAPDQSTMWPWSLFGGLFGNKKKSIADTKPSSKNEHGVSLAITNKVTDTGINQNTTYTVTYANVSGKNYPDVDIEVLLPLEYSFISTDKGDYYKDAHSVLVKLYEFETREKGTINIVAQATGKKSQKSAEASAHLYTDTTETIVYDIDNYNPKVAATSRSARGTTETSRSVKNTSRTSTSSANPLAGSTMIGWLIIAAIVGGVVFVSYKYFKKDKY